MWFRGINFYIFYLIIANISVAQECILSKNFKIKSDSLPSEITFVDRHRKIGRIENSQSNFEIRYYYKPSLVNGGRVIIINCAEGIIVARSISYWFPPRRPYERTKINRVEITELQPSISWGSFLDSLDLLNFFSFPTMEEIRPKMKKYISLDDGRVVEKRSQIMDGANYTYQIKVADKIRSFTYHSPLAWYKTYDNVPELKAADEFRRLFHDYLLE